MKTESRYYPKLFRHLRKQLIIYPQFQILLILVQLGVVLGVAIPFGFSVNRAFSHLESIATKAGVPKEHAFFKLLVLEKHLIFSTLAFPLGCFLLLCMVGMLVLSNRLAGPIVRLKRDFEKMEKTGQPEVIKFRENDFFPDLPALINRAIKKLVGGDSKQ